MNGEKLAYTVKEAAEALSISERLMKQQIYDGHIQAVKIGSRTVVPRWSLERRLGAPGKEEHDSADD